MPGAAASTVGDIADIDDNLPLLAIRGFGQSDDQMVPLHMAMVAATVANGGQMMKPYVVDAELRPRRPRASSTHTADGLEARRSAADRGDLDATLMVGVAERGTASCCIGLENGIPWPRRRARPSSTAAASRSGRTPGSSPSPRPRIRSTPSPSCCKGEERRDRGRHRWPLAGPIAKAMLDYLLTGAGSTVPLGASTIPSTVPATTPAGTDGRHADHRTAGGG